MSKSTKAERRAAEIANDVNEGTHDHITKEELRWAVTWWALQASKEAEARMAMESRYAFARETVKIAFAIDK